MDEDLVRVLVCLHVLVDLEGQYTKLCYSQVTMNSRE